MVERIASTQQKLDAIFGSLSDATRRDILRRVRRKNLSVGNIALYYRLSLAGVAKHLMVLERAGLIHKKRHGKEQIVSLNPQALATADRYLKTYEQLWEQRLNSLDQFLQSHKRERKR